MSNMEENTTSSIAESLVPQQEDIYVFIKFLGRGSFGTVNLYRNNTTNSLVVWKEIDLKRLDAKMRNEAFAEVEILSMLNNPNIISYYKHFIVDDTLYIELEYAKAGTLANLIHQQLLTQTFFDQDTILWYFYQLACAVNYIHEIGIMHRDIKAMNIFLMQSNLLKLGDFGIAKFLDPKIGFLETQVGTPFYLSPEIVEGKKYSTKSDIWALGCVAYELLTLKKVFEATNQLRLALKISACNVNDIDLDHYSLDIRQLVKSILSKDPDERPSAKEIISHSIFHSRVEEFNQKIENLNMVSKRTRTADTIQRELSSNSLDLSSTQQYFQKQIVASKLSEVYAWGGGKLSPKQLDIFKNENAPLHIACGTFHYAVINVEKELFTASHVGANNSSASKLGHANLMTKIPRRVEALAGISIEKVSCGDEMTCCLSEEGEIYICGNNINGCLGLGNENSSFDLGDENSDTETSNSNNDSINELMNVSTPIKVPFFKSKDLRIKSIACGDLHTIALSTCNRVFTWGCGEYGRLGHGDEDDRWEPTELTFKLRYTFKDVYAGSDCSFLLTTEGKVLAFGNNEYNKLCLNEGVIGFRNDDNRKSLQNNMTKATNQQLTPKLVSYLSNYEIFKICPGQNHTAVIDEYGRLFTFGSNRYGQLGVGDCKKRAGLNQVGGPLVGHYVTNASCGDTFTICSTSENLIFSWGNRQDGRLGLSVAFVEESSCVCLPKPIFGSLHLVSEMSCKHWHSMIIAEKILNSKSMRSVSYADYLRNNASRNSAAGANTSSSTAATSELDQDSQANKMSSFLSSSETDESVIADVKVREDKDRDETDDVPEWLKNDLADASFIPIKPVEAPNVQNKQTKDDESIKTLEEALSVINRLKKEVLKLKEENKQLREKFNN